MRMERIHNEIHVEIVRLLLVENTAKKCFSFQRNGKKNKKWYSEIFRERVVCPVLLQSTDYRGTLVAVPAGIRLCNARYFHFTSKIF